MANWAPQKGMGEKKMQSAVFLLYYNNVSKVPAELVNMKMYD